VSWGRLRVSAAWHPLARRFGAYEAGSLIAAASGDLGLVTHQADQLKFVMCETAETSPRTPARSNCGKVAADHDW
jgi:hypothetical protein